MDEAETPRSGPYSNSNEVWASRGPQQLYSFAPPLRGQQNTQMIAPGGAEPVQEQKGNTPLVNISFGGNSNTKDAPQISGAPTMPHITVKSDDLQVKSDDSRKSTPLVGSSTPGTGNAPLDNAKLLGLEERLQDLSQNLSNCQRQLQMQQTTNTMLVQELLLARKEHSRLKHHPPTMPRPGLPIPSVWSAGFQQRSWQSRLRDIDSRLEALDGRFQCMRR